MIKSYYIKLIHFGYVHWYKNKKLHRDNRPAVETKAGYKAWYLNGIFLKSSYK